jgi:hypothetical protein
MSASIRHFGNTGSLVSAIAARLSWGTLRAALGLAATSLAFHLLMARYFDFETDHWSVFVWSGIVISTTMGIGVVAAILCADEMSRRGESPPLAYPLCLLVISLVSGVWQWYIREWCGLLPLFDADQANALRDLNMIYMALDTLVWGAFAMFAYTHWQRESRCRQKVEQLQLDRMRLAQQLARSRLLATQAQVAPDWLLTMLDRIKQSYEVASPDAEPLLEELIAQLRERLNAVSAGFGPSS